MIEGQDECILDGCEEGESENRKEDALVELLELPICENFTTQSRRVMTFRSHRPVYDVVSEMRRMRRGAAVIESDDKIAGIFTDRDFLKAARCPSGVPVGELMTTNVVTLPPGASTKYLLYWYADNGLRHLPLVKNGMACGLVSAKDLLKLVCEKLRRHRVFHTPVSDVIGRDAKSVRRHLVSHPQDSIASAVEKMTVFSGGAVRVIENGELVGILSERDISRVILGEVSLDDKIEKIMSTRLHCTKSTEMLRHAMARMVRHGVRHEPILNDDGSSSGVLVQRDPLRLIVESYQVLHNLPDNPEQKYLGCEG